MTDQADQGSVLRRFFVRPQHIKIEVTNICNANCTFCAYQFMEREKDVMSMDVFRRVLDDYAQMGGGAVTLSSVVGDCLVDPHLLDRVRLMRSYEKLGMVITFTNLIALDKWDDDAVLELLESIDLWSISLAPNREVYSELFGVDRFERVVSNLQRLYRIRDRARKKPRMRSLGRAVTGPFEIDECLIQMKSFVIVAIGLLSTTIGAGSFRSNPGVRRWFARPRNKARPRCACCPYSQQSFFAMVRSDCVVVPIMTPL